MEDEKAKFIVYIVIALIAFVASSAVYSMTGGLSDWIVSSDYDEDKNDNGYLDSSENGGGLFSLFDSNDNSDNYNDNGDGSDWSEMANKWMDKLFNSDNSGSSSSYYSSSSSDDNPDILARLLRFFISNG